MAYTATIGLEVHAELKTKTKLFCNSQNAPDDSQPNANVCPVCMGHPGTLPVINQEALKHLVLIGVAVGGEIAKYTEFDRKNYFYPDIPKGYQISQYAYPIVTGGILAGVSLTRVHLEEDTARSVHTGTESHIDFNRAGVPLMELVTEPVIKNAEEAGDFARELQLLLRVLGVSDAHMEKGEMRVEANISISSDKTLGTKVEVKNLNSFRSVERAIAFELERQKKLLDGGGAVAQETRGWDELKQETFPQRLKESSHDYRYFPDPDVVKFNLAEIKEVQQEHIAKSLPELPWEKRKRYTEAYALPEDIADTLIRSFYADQRFLEEVAHTEDADVVRSIAHYIVSEIPDALQDTKDAFGKMKTGALVKIAEMKRAGKISSRGAKDIIAYLIKEGGDPETTAETKGLLQQSDLEELKVLASTLIEENPTAAEEYRKGKESSLQFLVGQGMKATKGSANPTLLQEALQEVLARR